MKKRNETTVSNGFISVTRVPSGDLPKFVSPQDPNMKATLLRMLKRSRQYQVHKAPSGQVELTSTQ